MLDTDNPDTPATDDTPATEGTPAPRTRAPRRAAKKAVAAPDATEPVVVGDDAAASGTATPRKRVPRKSAAKQAAPAATESAESVVPTAPGEAVDFSEPAPTPAKRPSRRRVAKAPATEIPFDEQSAPSTGTPDATAHEPGSADAETDSVPAPAKRPTRRRATKAAAAVLEPAATSDAATSSDTASTSDAATTGDRPPAAMSTPGVLFIAPQEVEATPARRRRPAKKAAANPAPAADDTDLHDSDPHNTGAHNTGARDTEGHDSENDDTEVREDEAGHAETPDAETSDDTADGDADGTADPDDIREAAIEQANGARRRRRRGRRGRGGGARSDETSDGDPSDDGDASDGTDAGTDPSAESGNDEDDDAAEAADDTGNGSSRRRRRRRRSGSAGNANDDSGDDPPNTVTHVREKAEKKSGDDDGVRGIKGSTRLEAKRQRRRDGRETTRRRAPILTEAEFLARREAVDRVMAVRQLGDRTQIAVLEDDILVEHYVTRASATSYVGNVYLGRVQNVLPSMEAAFVDIGKGRNGVLYAGEVNWDAAGLDGKSRTIEHAMKSGDSVLVQVTKDPIGHKGARLTSQISLPGRFLVYVPGGGMTGISRRLPDTERHRLKAILKKIVPDEAGVIVRTAAEGASEEDLTHDVERLQAQWESIREKSSDAPGAKSSSAPALLHGEPDLAIRVVRDVFNEDFAKLVVEGDDAWTTVSDYVATVAPDLAERASRYTGTAGLFHDLRVDEQLAKALDRKVWLPSGGSLVIDRTEAMTVVDVNTGRFVGSGGNLEQTVTRNNLEAAEEIVRQLRLRDVGGIVVIDFIDMVLESNRDLVLRRLTECLGRDRTKHQVAEVTSLGLVQMTRKRVGEGLLEAFSEPCEHCHGRGVIVHSEPVDQSNGNSEDDERSGSRKRGRRNGRSGGEPVEVEPPASTEQRQAATAAIAAIHRATASSGGTAPDDDSALATLASDLVNAAMDAAGTDSAAPVTSETADESNAAELPEAPGASDATEESDAPEASDASGLSDAVEVPQDAEVPEPPAPQEPVQPARRRRRAASRPAGPPVHT